MTDDPRVCPCGWAGEYVYAGRFSRKECPRCGRYESEARNATPDRAAELTVADVERKIAADRDLIRRSREARMGPDQRFAVWFVRRYRKAMEMLGDD